MTVQEFLGLVGHIILFTVRTPGSKTGYLVQHPCMLVQDIQKTSEGHIVIRGIDFKKIGQAHTITDSVRGYRLDRIQGAITDMGRMQHSPYLLGEGSEIGFTKSV